MGRRGKQRAKETKKAREFKYLTPPISLEDLRRELAPSEPEPIDVRDDERARSDHLTPPTVP